MNDDPQNSIINGKFAISGLQNSYGILADVCVKLNPECLVIQDDRARVRVSDWQTDIYDKVFRTSNLTHFDVSQHRDVWLPQVHTSQWLDLLSQKPSLERLVLDGYNINARDNTIRNSTLEVCLPHLQTFHYTSEIGNCDDLFGYLIFPPSCIVNLSLNHNTSLVDTNLGGLRKGVSRFLNSWVPEKNPSAAISRQFQWEFTIGKQGISVAISELSASSEYYEEPHFRLQYEIDNEEDTEMEFLDRPISLVSALFSVLKHAGSSVMGHVATIVLDVSYDFDTLWHGDECIRTGLIAFLSSLKSVRDVSIRGESVLNICDQLFYNNFGTPKTATPSSFQPATEELLFPDLEHLSAYISAEKRHFMRKCLNYYVLWRKNILPSRDEPEMSIHDDAHDEDVCDDDDEVYDDDNHDAYGSDEVHGFDTFLTFHSGRCEDCHEMPRSSLLKKNENGRIFRQYTSNVFLSNNAL